MNRFHQTIPKALNTVSSLVPLTKSQQHLLNIQIRPIHHKSAVEIRNSQEIRVMDPGTDERALIGDILTEQEVEEVSADDPRLTPAYHAYYYSQRPLDPKLPPPLFDSSRWHQGRSQNVLQTNKDAPNPLLDPSWPGTARATGEPAIGEGIRKKHVKSPLEMIQSDFPATSSPIYLSAPTKDRVPSNTLSALSQRRDSFSFLSPHQQLQSLSLEDSRPQMQYRNQFFEPQSFEPTVKMDSSRPYNPIPSEQVSRSALMQELRVSKGSSVALEAVLQHHLVTEFATDQNGSRFIQQRLETASAEHKEELFVQLAPRVLELCSDVFGNYVVQKFLEFGLLSHQKALALLLKGHVLELALQMYGCRVIQKALEVLPEDQQVSLVSELEGHVLQCVKDQNGNHVIQKCIEKVPPKHIQFVVRAFDDQVFSLSTHAYGCRVIQRLLEYCSEDQKNVILNQILDRVLALVSDQYGNYVIQHVLQRGASEYRSAIIAQVIEHVLDLSKHKFASNVIEKCFVFASANEKHQLVSIMIGGEECCPIAEMVKDQYANYVVQKVLGVVSDFERDRIIDTIESKVPNIRKISYGKHIVAKIEKMTGRVL